MIAGKLIAAIRIEKISISIGIFFILQFFRFEIL